MDAEVTLFSKPEELIVGADTFDILLNPSIEDAAILLKKALAAGVPKSTILTYFYPEVTVEKMSSYRQKQ